jgi:hypothetical protein
LPLAGSDPHVAPCTAHTSRPRLPATSNWRTCLQQAGAAGGELNSGQAREHGMAPRGDAGAAHVRRERSCGRGGRPTAAARTLPRGTEPSHQRGRGRWQQAGGPGPGRRASQLKERDPLLLLAWTTARCNANAKSTSLDWMLQKAPRTIRRIFTIAIRTSSYSYPYRVRSTSHARSASASSSSPRFWCKLTASPKAH